MSLLAIDPGFAEKSGTGFAWFVHGMLARVGCAGTPPGDLRLRARAICRVFQVEMSNALRVVIELPRVYPLSRQKGDQNDLIDLAYLAGALDSVGIDGELVHPRTWKGQVPKAVMGRRILAALQPEEHALVEKIGAGRHNAIDAAGLGLWALGRLGR